MQVERFFHIRRRVPNGGATVRVTGDTDHPTQVSIQAAFCSKKDAYCKQTGRDLAASRTPKIIPLRSLPRELNNIQRQAARICHDPVIWYQDYTFALRYFLPKEL